MYLGNSMNMQGMWEGRIEVHCVEQVIYQKSDKCRITKCLGRRWQCILESD